MVEFFGEQVNVKGYNTLRITFGEKGQTKKIKVRYLAIDALSLYNMIIGRPIFNRMNIVSNERARVIQGDQEISRKCYT